ncbi:MAG: hypothetical protein KBG47_08910 [Bacteroidia bacterium]|jgi:flagellar basal body-associated protein FliL|nr:hypothetical protein [Sphingobacteriaceae bacterium]MBK7309808.1 hypothetical protein [Sphingobacteriaceae bacterium]MBK7819356.1 hypothetical protein [Sphingobacteriaceae bacterium]MBP9069614.1 hypothetical protein [Bacteroidia bacterium]
MFRKYFHITIIILMGALASFGMAIVGAVPVKFSKKESTEDEEKKEVVIKEKSESKIQKDQNN